MSDVPAPAVQPIPFVDLQAQRRRLGGRLELAVHRVFEHGRFILGPEVFELEERLAAFSGSRHAITCANGTDALTLALAALGVRRGDAVLVPSFTFAATAEVVPWLGAVPVFVDVLKDTFNMDLSSLERGIETARAQCLRPAGVIAVDLFGQPADYDALAPIAEAHGLWLVGDAAQSFGATYRGRRVGTLARITTTSFFPAKPLGCYGDGGALFTDDDLAALLRSLRVHGQGCQKYDNVRIGVNSRLDTIQAAILLEKLAVFPDEVEARQRAAGHYSEALAGAVAVPTVIDGASSVWAQYTIRFEGAEKRDAAIEALRARGIPSVVYFPPLHRQRAYEAFPTAAGGLPITEALSEVVLSLPMHACLDPTLQARIVDCVRMLPEVVPCAPR